MTSSAGAGTDDRRVIDPKWYRQVLGQYPTGVCVVTAQAADGEAIAMVVGSFSSVSLDPPLIAFFPDRNSSSWARLRPCEKFCVNVLAADQEELCRRLASKDPKKFDGVSHRISPLGNLLLEGAVAWIECRKHAVTDAGDHEMVSGLVLDLDVGAGGLPLLFFRGGYGRFTPGTLVADQEHGISLAQLRGVDCARIEMDKLVERVGGVCIATVRVGDELAIAASAGQGRSGGAATLVGQRLPFTPPTGGVFAAWLTSEKRQKWAARASRPAATLASLEAVRRRGYSIGLRNEAQRVLSDRLLAAAEDRQPHIEMEDLLEALAYDPVELDVELKRDIRLVSAPVFDSSDGVELALTLYDFPKPDGADGIERYIDELLSATAAATVKLSSRKLKSDRT